MATASASLDPASFLPEIIRDAAAALIGESTLRGIRRDLVDRIRCRLEGGQTPGEVLAALTADAEIAADSSGIGRDDPIHVSYTRFVERLVQQVVRQRGRRKPARVRHARRV
jgi:hypothetical protein